ncbi:hypothetical protein V1511DRAFT_495981 [Dipodascopsis uninucleata]
MNTNEIDSHGNIAEPTAFVGSASAIARRLSQDRVFDNLNGLIQAIDTHAFMLGFTVKEEQIDESDGRTTSECIHQTVVFCNIRRPESLINSNATNKSLGSCPWSLILTSLPEAGGIWRVDPAGDSHNHCIFPFVPESLRTFDSLSITKKARIQALRSSDRDGPFTQDIRSLSRVCVNPSGTVVSGQEALDQASLIWLSSGQTSPAAELTITSVSYSKRGRPPRASLASNSRVASADSVSVKSRPESRSAISTAQLSSKSSNSDKATLVSDANKTATSLSTVATKSNNSSGRSSLVIINQFLQANGDIEVKTLMNPVTGGASAMFMMSIMQAKFAERFSDLILIDTRSVIRLEKDGIAFICIAGVDHEMRTFPLAVSMFTIEEPRIPYLWVLKQLRAQLSSRQMWASYSHMRFVVNFDPDLLTSLYEVYPSANIRLCRSEMSSLLGEFGTKFLVSEMLDLAAIADKTEYAERRASLESKFSMNPAWTHISKTFLSPDIENLWMDSLMPAAYLGIKSVVRVTKLSESYQTSLNSSLQLTDVMRYMYDNIFSLHNFLQKDAIALVARMNINVGPALKPLCRRVSTFALAKLVSEFASSEIKEQDEDVDIISDNSISKVYNLPRRQELEILDEVPVEIIPRRWHVPAVSLPRRERSRILKKYPNFEFVIGIISDQPALRHHLSPAQLASPGTLTVSPLNNLLGNVSAPIPSLKPSIETTQQSLVASRSPVSETKPNAKWPVPPMTTISQHNSRSTEITSSLTLQKPLLVRPLMLSSIKSCARCGESTHTAEVCSTRKRRKV